MNQIIYLNKNVEEILQLKFLHQNDFLHKNSHKLFQLCITMLSQLLLFNCTNSFVIYVPSTFDFKFLGTISKG